MTHPALRVVSITFRIGAVFPSALSSYAMFAPMVQSRDSRAVSFEGDTIVELFLCAQAPYFNPSTLASSNNVCLR